MDVLELRRLADTSLLLDEAPPPPRGTPGRSSMTSRISPGVVLRVSDRETARALGESLRGRDANGVARGADRAVAAAGGSAGAPLRGDLRERFEASLGADLSAVRVHTGAASAEASQAVGAKAYTLGNDIHFGAGQYQPDDPFGMHLLAHEVAHTVQQSGGATERQHKLEVSAPQDAAEVEADQAADAMVNGNAFAIAGASSAIARKEDAAAPPAADGAKGDEKEEKPKFPVGMDGVTIGKVKIPWSADQISISQDWSAEEKIEKNIIDKQLPIPAGALPGGLSLSAKADASLGASASASISGELIPMPPPHVDENGARITASGKAELAAEVTGLVGVGGYVGVPAINIGAEGYLQLSATASAAAELTGSATYAANAGWSGTVTFSVPLEAKITASGGIRLIYASFVKNGELQKFELASADIAKAMVTCKVVYDVGSGEVKDSVETEWAMLPLNFATVPLSEAEKAQYRQRAKQEEDDRDGASGGGGGVPPEAYDPEPGSFEEQCQGEDASVMCE